MKTPLVRQLSWTLAALGVLLAVCGLALSLAAGSDTNQTNVVRVVSAMAFGVLGAVIVTRQPSNPIGWIFCIVSVFYGLGLLARGYTELWLAHGVGPDMLGKTTAVYQSAGWVIDLMLPINFLLLLFPDGRLPGRRWRPISACAAIGLVGFFVNLLLDPGPLDSHPQVDNPYGINPAVTNVLNNVFLILLVVGLIGSVASLIVRFRHAAFEARQQIKWMAVAGAAAAAVFVAMMFTPLYGVVGEDTAYAVLMVSVLGLPVAAAFAILRYRLYDIDVVINRALVYGTLTAILAGTYLGSVLLLQLALNQFTAGSGLAVAASTLATAALVRPARARIQASVDRRFFRRKYDAAQTLERFGTRVRNEVDLDTLTAELRTVVAETMQPTHVTLWKPEGSR
ncbi:MAG: hypothetical protein ABIR57_04280 [Aeromicrobium sp.]